jgi:hypothetical protein
VVLGGTPRLFTLWVGISQLLGSAALIGWPVFRALTIDVAIRAFLWWFATNTVWSGICAGLSLMRLTPSAAAFPPSAAARSTGRGRIPMPASKGVTRLAAILLIRTLRGRLVPSLLFVAVVGGFLIPAVHRINGGGAAALAAAVVLAVVLMSLASATRSAVGRQHLFIVWHRRHVRRSFWRSLVLGETLALSVVALTMLVLVCVGSPASWTGGGVALAACVVFEWAMCLGAIAHLLSPGLTDDGWMRTLLLPAFAVVALGLIVVSWLLASVLISTWAAALLAVGGGFLVVPLASRPPLFIGAADRLGNADA